MPTRTIPAAEFKSQTAEARAKAAGISLIDEKAAAEEIDRRMQAGWKMLNEACPISDCPLIEKDGIKYSARCNLEVLSESKAAGMQLTPQSPTMPAESAPAEPSPTGSDDSYEMVSEMPEVQSRMNDVDAQSALMGKLLLKGWRMLDRVDDAGCPLMEEPGTAREFSVAADCFTDEMQSSAQQMPPSPVAPAASPMRLKQRLAKSGEPPARSRPEASQSTAPAASAASNQLSDDEQSAKMGELLLKGWAMLEAVCPVTRACPLMQEPATQRKFSVALNRFVDELEGGQFADVPEDEQEESSHAALEQTTQRLEEEHHTGLTDDDEEEHSVRSRYEAARQQLLTSSYEQANVYGLGIDESPQEVSKPTESTAPVSTQQSLTSGADGVSQAEMSQQLSELLLKGWAMLDEACPVTGAVNLMQSPDGRKYSVATASFVDEAPKIPTTQPAERSANKTASAAPCMLSTALEVPEVLKESYAAITAKMSEANQLLITAGPVEARQIVELIEACAKALKSLSL